VVNVDVTPNLARLLQYLCNHQRIIFCKNQQTRAYETAVDPPEEEEEEEAAAEEEHNCTRSPAILKLFLMVSSRDTFGLMLFAYHPIDL
jgi:hypothetical protein